MKQKHETSKPLLIRTPADVREWLEEQVVRNLTTMQAEVVRALRERMAAEQASGEHPGQFSPTQSQALRNAAENNLKRLRQGE